MPLKNNNTAAKLKPKITVPEFEFIKSSEAWTRFTMMLYGTPGIGKTWLAGTSAQVKIMQPILVIDTDGSYRTLQGKKQFDGLDIVRIRDFGSLSNVYNKLVAPGKYKTIVLENLGEIHTLAMDELMSITTKKNPNQNEYVPSMREYGIVRKQMLNVLKHFTLDEEINLIVTCHAKKYRDELTGRESIFPNIPGKLATDVPGYVDIVGYLSVEEPKLADRTRGVEAVRVVRFQPSPKIEAKDQSDKLGQQLENPTMQTIIDLIGLKGKATVK